MKNMKQPIRLNPECVSCLVKKQIERYPKDIPSSDKIKYMQSVLQTVAQASEMMSAPEIVDKIYKIQKQMFGADKDYTEIKSYFNNMMSELETDIRREINKSSEQLKTAVQYAITGNYIDFAAMDSIDENKLREMLKSAPLNAVDEAEYAALKRDLMNAKQLVFLTDNCGEIVLDKILIETITNINPGLDITVIVRGQNVVNDATMADAEQIGLTKQVRVTDNGSSIAGTCLNRISAEARHIIENADVIISKGQGNFETLQKCGLNVYYIFMCKCKMFADRFNVPLYSGILINDKTVCEIIR